MPCDQTNPLLQVRYFRAQGVGRPVTNVFRQSKSEDELLGTNPGRVGFLTAAQA